MITDKHQFDDQQFSNEYQLVNGVAMHAENPDNFQIPPDVIKRHVKPSQFVELRIDSRRFSVHEDSAEKCFRQLRQSESIFQNTSPVRNTMIAMKRQGVVFQNLMNDQFQIHNFTLPVLYANTPRE